MSVQTAAVYNQNYQTPEGGKCLVSKTLEGVARYAGQLLGPAEGFGKTIWHLVFALADNIGYNKLYVYILDLISGFQIKT